MKGNSPVRIFYILLVGILLASAAPAVVGATDEGGSARPPAAMPFFDEQGEQIKETVPEVSIMVGLAGLGSPGSGFIAAADWLRSQQTSAGCFPWTPGGSCPPNTQGPSARGLLKAYQHTTSAIYKSAAEATGNYLVPNYPRTFTDGDPRFATHDPLFLEELSQVTGNSIYANFVQTHFWDKLTAGTYGENNDMDASEFGASVVSARASQRIVELSPWDLSATAIAAHVAGETAHRDALMAQVLAGLNATTASDNDYDVIGLAGAVWASAITGYNLDPTSGRYVGYSTTAELAGLLASWQRSSDGAWLWSTTADPGDVTNGDLQSTAFAIMALNSVNSTLYHSQVARGAAFIRSLQQTSGQFLIYPTASPSANGSVESHAEALASLVTVAPDVVYVDDNWSTGVNPGDDPDGSGPAVAYGYDAFATISEGVDSVSPGGTVHVADGTYVEQVVISRDVTLLGSGSNTIVQAPNTVPVCFTTSADQHPIVCIKDGATATIDGFTIDGAGKGNANYRFVGIGFHNAGGTIQNTTIKDIRDTPFSGSQHGVAIYAYNEDGINRTINVWDNVLTGFQKNGMALNASNTTPLDVDVQRNQVTGYGATTITAQNGIQVWADQGTGVVANNTITGIAYDNTNSATKWVASSILNFYADLQITKNTVSQGHVGVYNIDGASQINDNDLTIEKVGVSAYGIIATDPLDAVPSPLGEEDSLAEVQLHSLNKLQATTLNITASDNEVQFSGADKTATYGIEADAGYGANNLAFTANGNEVSGFEVGIEIYQCSGGSCGSGVFTAVTANRNRLTGNTFGIRSNVPSPITNGENNWWGSPCGPSGEGPGNGDAVSTYVDFSPWWADPTGASTATEGAGGEIVIPTGATTAQAQAILNCAVGKTVMFEGGSYPGGLVINGNGTTVKLNGCIVGPGSPAFTIVGDDVTILGPGVLDGWTGSANNTSPAILVQPGADNFTIDGVEIKRWADGIQVAGAVTSLKVVNNWIHDNTDAGLQVDGAVGGVVTIEGNLFKANGGHGVAYTGLGTLDAEYNSWGDLGGPNAPGGDGADAAKVDFDPWTFAEVFVDVDPDNEATQRTVTEVQTFAVKLKVDAAKLYGLAFKLSYDPNVLTLNSLTFAAPWAGRCETVGTPTAGVLAYRCDLQLPTAEYGADGGTIATLTFTPISANLSGNGPWFTQFDLAHLEADTSASAVGGVKVFVNNAGYGAPSAPDRNITDANDGQINIAGIARFTGFVDLQGRTNDSGAVVQVFGSATITGATTLAQGTSAASGAYTTNYTSPYLLTIGTTYWFQVDAPLYLPTTARATSPSYSTLPTGWQHSKPLSTRPTTALQNVILLGGDATDDNVIDISDASCIGSRYMQPAAPCGSGGNADVNGDGTVTMRDLTLMGGNYYRTASPWTP
jgi:hypothetical protein